MKVMLYCTFICLLLFLAIEQGNAKPFVELGSDVASSIKTCGNLLCPKGTVTCKVRKRTSEDGNNILTESQCISENDDILDSQTDQQPNPYKGNVQIQSYSYKKIINNLPADDLQ